jgi:hypothetical protein
MTPLPPQSVCRCVRVKITASGATWPRGSSWGRRTESGSRTAAGEEFRMREGEAEPRAVSETIGPRFDSASVPPLASQSSSFHGS